MGRVRREEKSRGEKGRRRSEKRKSQKQKDVGARKGRKVAKPCVFLMTIEEDLQRCISHGRRSTRDIFIGAVRKSGP